MCSSIGSMPGLIAPLLAFTTEEVWSYTAKPAGAPESVHLALLPEPAEVASGLPAARLAEWDRLMEVRDVVLKALEEARQAKLIGTSLEARVRLQGYKGFEDELPAVFIVSQVVLEAGANLVVTRRLAQAPTAWRATIAEAVGLYAVLVVLTLALFLGLGGAWSAYQGDAGLWWSCAAGGVACAALHVQRFCAGVWRAFDGGSFGDAFRWIPGSGSAK